MRNLSSKRLHPSHPEVQQAYTCFLDSVGKSETPDVSWYREYWWARAILAVKSIDVLIEKSSRLKTVLAGGRHRAGGDAEYQAAAEEIREFCEIYSIDRELVIKCMTEGAFEADNEGLRLLNIVAAYNAAQAEAENSEEPVFTVIDKISNPWLLVGSAMLPDALPARCLFTNGNYGQPEARIVYLNGNPWIEAARTVKSLSGRALSMDHLRFLRSVYSNHDEADVGAFMQILGRFSPVRFYPGEFGYVSNSDLPDYLTLSAEPLSALLRVSDPVRAARMIRDYLSIGKAEAIPRLDELSGMGGVERDLRQMANDLEAWNKGDLAWSDMCRSILLHGEPGTGKTFLAKSLAKTVGGHFEMGSYAHWSGEGKNGGGSNEVLARIKASFQRAKAKAPSVMLIDEIDVFCPRGDGGSNAYYNRLLVDGMLALLDPEEMEGVLIVGATNDIEAVDKALRREGRFDKVLKTSLPGQAEISRIIRMYLAEFPEEDLLVTSKHLEGSTPAQIATAARDLKTRVRHEGVKISGEALVGAVKDRCLDPPSRAIGFSLVGERSQSCHG